MTAMKAVRRYGEVDGLTVFHYVAAAPPTRVHAYTLCGKATDSPTLSKETAVLNPKICAKCCVVLLNARAREMLAESRALVEDAQHTLEKAAQACGGVSGGGAIANSKIALLASKAHALWRYLNYKFETRYEKRVSLDGANAEPFLRYYEQYGGDVNDRISFYVNTSARLHGQPVNPVFIK